MNKVANGTVLLPCEVGDERKYRIFCIRQNRPVCMTVYRGEFQLRYYHKQRQLKSQPFPKPFVTLAFPPVSWAVEPRLMHCPRFFDRANDGTPAFDPPGIPENPGPLASPMAGCGLTATNFSEEFPTSPLIAKPDGDALA